MTQTAKQSEKHPYFSCKEKTNASIPSHEVPFAEKSTSEMLEDMNRRVPVGLLLTAPSSSTLQCWAARAHSAHILASCSFLDLFYDMSSFPICIHSSQYSWKPLFGDDKLAVFDGDTIFLPYICPWHINITLGLSKRLNFTNKIT